jgi:signal transduction histidine kinase
VLKRNVYKNYAYFFETRGDFRRANDFHRKYEALNDSIYSEGSAVKLAEMQALYQVEKKDQEVQLLSQQRQIQDDQITLQQAQLRQRDTIIIWAISSVFLVLLAGFIGYRYYQAKSKAHQELTNLHKEIIEQQEEIQAQSEELVEANETISSINRELEAKVENRTAELKQAYKELDTFFYRSSHDFRRPLTTFLGLSEVAKITVKDVNALELFDKVRETAHYLDKMLVKLQSISDLGTQQLVYKEVFIKELVGEIAGNYDEELSRRQIAFQDEVTNRTAFFSYPAMVKIILENMIENAIMFAGVVNRFIKVRAFDQGPDLVIEVSDNGQGIHKEYQDRVFDMYFRGNENSRGNGLGLYIVKKAVEKLKGRITFESEYGIGSIFTISLPNTV